MEVERAKDIRKSAMVQKQESLKHPPIVVEDV
jgi:hypothetical protein